MAERYCPVTQSGKELSTFQVAGVADMIEPPWLRPKLSMSLVVADR